MKEINALISIKETASQIEKKIKIAIGDELNTKYSRVIDKITNFVKKSIYDAVTSQPEYYSLISGQLRIELGLTDGDTRLINILEVWLQGLSVEFSKFRISASNLTGGITIRAIRSDYSEVLSISDSEFITEKGERLPWLSWLLLSGTQTEIANYSIVYGVFGRTGGGHMVPGGSWSVPAAFAGQDNNNFVTRAMVSVQKDIESYIEKLLRA
jgi:hypothetical protein